MNLPRFITFTGVDAHTDVAEMCALSHLYPIEWGVLFSPARQGTGRYPPLSIIREIVRDAPLDFAAHLCGGYSRDVLIKNATLLDPLITDFFGRAQVNTSEPGVRPVDIARWAALAQVKPILQCRGIETFPEDLHVSWLFDASGGRGLQPAAWPRPPERYRGLFVGYAGGLAPDNVAGHVERIGQLAVDYWIDMETGVRDENDRFDLARCRAVCEAVYGSR